MKNPSPAPAHLRDMAGCVCFALRRTTREVTQMYDAGLRPHRLRVTQLPILVAASRREPVLLAPLAEWLGMERTTLLRNVRPLIRRRLVDVRTTGAGRSEIRTTAAGRALLARVYPAWKRVQARVLRSMAGVDWSRSLDSLGRAARRAAK